MAMERFEPFLQAWRERWRRQDAEAAVRATEALRTAERLAQSLIERHGARRVWLTGSLARGSEFRVDSDIDLVVEGVPDAGFFRADAAIAREAYPFEVDLVPFESATEAFKAELERDGWLLRG